MHKEIYVNLPVKDLKRSMAFFERIGYRFDPRFTNDKAAGLILGGNLFAMLLPQPFFATFTTKPVSDAMKATEMLVALACESRDEVDALVAKAKTAGASVPREATDYGFMYQHGYHDLDGHVWELFWADPNVNPAEQA